MKVYVLLFGCLALASLFIVPAKSETIDWSKSCSEWTYDPNGGFEGKEPTASVNCGKKADTPPELQIICHGTSVSIRYIDGDGNKGADKINGRPLISYAFGTGVFADHARYEGAFGDWVIYKATVDLDHPIFDAFSSEQSVVVSMSHRKVVDRISLKNSRAAISKVIKSCEK